MDITDNFPNLNTYIFIGDTKTEAFLEKVVGYLFGFTFVFIGFWYWFPLVPQIQKAKNNLIKSNKQLKQEIKKHKDTQVKLKKSYNKLKTLDKMKDDFIAILSHELRTPITIIKGYASIILHDHKHEINNSTKGHIKKILDGAQGLIHMVNNMLDIARIESDKTSELEIEQIDIKELIQEVCSNFLPLMQKRENKIQISLSKTQLPMVLCDRSKLKQVLNNLIDNAIKYTKEKDGIIKISARKYKKQIKISVEDNGIGVAKKYHKKIFEKFGLAGSSLHHTTSGTGLGLAICKQIIEQYNGKINLKSTLNKGAKFIFTLPVE